MVRVGRAILGDRPVKKQAGSLGSDGVGSRIWG